MFLRKGVLKICNKFTGENPCRIVIAVKLFRMVVCLLLCSIFSEKLFLRAPQDGCFWVSKILLKHLVVIGRISLTHYLSKVMHLLLFVLYRFFTNIPLDRTIKIILKRIYEYKLITTTLKRVPWKGLGLMFAKKNYF